MTHIKILEIFSGIHLQLFQMNRFSLHFIQSIEN